MGDNAIAVDFDASVRSDLADLRHFLRRGAGQVNSLGTCLVGLSGAGSGWAHGQ
jgi:hypothetical protein